MTVNCLTNTTALTRVFVAAWEIGELDSDAVQFADRGSGVASAGQGIAPLVVSNAASGPVQQTVSLLEADLQLNLTGGKSWHRVAPFVGAGVGLTFPSGTPADTSGFELGKRFYFAPGAGFRFFVTNRVHLRAEARAAFWKLKYPASFTREPPDEPGDPPDNSNAVITDGRVSEWSTSSWIQVGLGFAFSP